MRACERHNVRIDGAGARPIMFAHGFGCDQSMWRHVAPEFARACAEWLLVATDPDPSGGAVEDRHAR